MVTSPSNRDGSSAFARASIHQAPGSCLRLVRFRGGEILYDRQDQLVLSMGVSAAFALDIAGDGQRGSVVPLINRFGLLPPGERFHVRLHGECMVLQLVLPRDVLAGWLSEDWDLDGSRVEFPRGHGVDDLEVSRLLWSARGAGVEHEASILRAVAARLYERLSPGARPLARARGGLPAHKLKRVIELVEDNPGTPFSVENLAREVAMSPFHFAHQFRLSVGRPPHRFMLDRQLSRAVSLLGDTRLPVTEVAARCNFAHASHLSRQLRRVLGQSPTELRRAVQS